MEIVNICSFLLFDKCAFISVMNYRGFPLVILNPAKVNAQMPEGTTYDEYMAICFAMLEMTDTIFMLHEWRNSRGAQMERRFALEKDYDILYER